MMACSANHSKGSGHGSQQGHHGPSGLIVGPNAWLQRKVHLRPQHRGVHLVTEEILRGVSEMRSLSFITYAQYFQLPELSQFSVGLMHIQLLHTSASLAINENWDPDVRDDMEMMLNRIVPEDLPFRHSCEGPDDMVRHSLQRTEHANNSLSVSARPCEGCLLYTSPSPRDRTRSRMPSSA